MCESLPAVYSATWTLMAMPPNQLAALQRRVVWKVSILAVSGMIPLLQQGMLCPCKSRLLLPRAMCLGTIGASSLFPSLTCD